MIVSFYYITISLKWLKTNLKNNAMKKSTIAIWVLILFAGISGYSQNAPISTIGTVTSQGITATVPINAINFTNISGFKLTITYDPTIVSIPPASNSPYVTVGPLLLPYFGGVWSANTLNSGIIVIQTSAAAGVTLTGNPLIANIVFSKIMDGTSYVNFYDDGFSCSWYDGSFNLLNDTPFGDYYNNGSVTFQSLPAPVTTAPVLSACPGVSIQVPITVTGFTNIGAVSLTLHYNATVLTYNSGTNNSGFPGLIINGPTPGTVIIGGYSSTPVTLIDNSTFLTLNFNCSGVGGY